MSFYGLQHLPLINSPTIFFTKLPPLPKFIKCKKTHHCHNIKLPILAPPQPDPHNPTTDKQNNSQPLKTNETTPNLSRHKKQLLISQDRKR